MLIEKEYKQIELDLHNLKAKSHHAPVIRLLGETNIDEPEVNQACEIFLPLLKGAIEQARLRR